jgi:hypothetical protein
LPIPLHPPRGGYEKIVSIRESNAKTVPQRIMLITDCIVSFINKHYQPLSCMVLYIVYININPL